MPLKALRCAVLTSTKAYTEMLPPKDHLVHGSRNLLKSALVLHYCMSILNLTMGYSVGDSERGYRVGSEVLLSLPCKKRPSTPNEIFNRIPQMTEPFCRLLNPKTFIAVLTGNDLQFLPIVCSWRTTTFEDVD